MNKQKRYKKLKKINEVELAEDFIEYLEGKEKEFVNNVFSNCEYYIEYNYEKEKFNSFCKVNNNWSYKKQPPIVRIFRNPQNCYFECADDLSFNLKEVIENQLKIAVEENVVELNEVEKSYYEKYFHASTKEDKQKIANDFLDDSGVRLEIFEKANLYWTIKNEPREIFLDFFNRSLEDKIAYEIENDIAVYSDFS